MNTIELPTTTTGPDVAGPVRRTVVLAAPQRVQLSRAKGWRMPPHTVRVARPGKWGNRFRIGDVAVVSGESGVVKLVPVRDAATAVQLFEQWVTLHLEQHPKIMRPALDELRGKNLACWCRLGQPCHADVLLRLANEERHNAEVPPGLRDGACGCSGTEPLIAHP